MVFDTITLPGTLAAATHVLQERDRQMKQEGYWPDRDDRYVRGELVEAAIAYALASIGNKAEGDGFWPWNEAGYKSGERRHDLVRACALLLAEIERLDRESQRVREGGE